MYLKNRVFAIILRAVGLLIGVAGVLVSSLSGSLFFSSWVFYTTMSNLLAIVYFAVTLARTIIDTVKEGPHGRTSYYPTIAMIVAVDILVTFLVYWIMLAPTTDDQGRLVSFQNMAVHTITPLLMIVDYLFFNRKRTLKRYTPLFVIIFPYLYIAFSLILGANGYVFGKKLDGTIQRAPYFFLDIYNQGWLVLAYVVGLSVFFIGLSYLVYLLDRKGPAKEYFIYLNEDDRI